MERWPGLVKWCLSWAKGTPGWEETHPSPVCLVLVKSVLPPAYGRPKERNGGGRDKSTRSFMWGQGQIFASPS